MGMIAPKDQWLDRDAGPVVRPYAMTRGRTGPAAGTSLGMIDVVLAAGAQPPAGVRMSPEHRRILALCGEPMTVVDLASDIDLPVGVVRVLLSDLSQYGMIRILATPRGPATNERLLRDVLDGLHAL
jgi:Protein of unknown function (DUF742)